EDQLDLMPANPWTSSTGRVVDAVQAFTGGEELLAPSKPPPDRSSSESAADVINIAASLACTIAARPTVRTAARAPLNTRRGVVRPLCLREPQTCSFGCLGVGCNCDMSWPLAV